jgi:hypothetical protein
MKRREPSSLTTVCTRADATCAACQRKIGVEMITTYDGVVVETAHVECPAYPAARAAAQRLMIELLKETR